LGVVFERYNQEEEEKSPEIPKYVSGKKIKMSQIMPPTKPSDEKEVRIDPDQLSDSESIQKNNDQKDDVRMATLKLDQNKDQKMDNLTPNSGRFQQKRFLSPNHDEKYSRGNTVGFKVSNSPSIREDRSEVTTKTKATIGTTKSRGLLGKLLAATSKKKRKDSDDESRIEDFLDFKCEQFSEAEDEANSDGEFNN
jgi:hypothetical protein